MRNKMAKRVLVQWVAAFLLIALMGESMAIPICGIETDELEHCRPAVKGKYPPPPNKECCNVVCHAQLSCLCGYKKALSAFQIDPKNAMELPKKCHVKKIPPECHWP